MLRTRLLLVPIALALLVATVLLFRGGPATIDSRSVAELWNCGHIVYFCLLVLLLLRLPRVQRLPPGWQWAGLLGFCLVAGSLIEILQYFFHRDAELADVMRDVGGGLLALAFAPATGSTPRRTRRWPIRLTSLTVLAVLLWPLVRSVLDETIARRQFPVLANFETPFETGRWEAHPGLAIRRMPFSGDGHVLQIPLTTSLYSGIALRYFPGDWHAYRFLHAEFYNPGPGPLRITCRIHDRQHDQGKQEYADRYNRRFLLAVGWNRLEFDLQAVAAAPRQRRMDLGAIRGFGCFATALPAPRLLYLDNLELSNSPVTGMSGQSHQVPALHTLRATPAWGRLRTGS